MSFTSQDTLPFKKRVWKASTFTTQDFSTPNTSATDSETDSISVGITKHPVEKFPIPFDFAVNNVNHAANLSNYGQAEDGKITCLFTNQPLHKYLWPAQEDPAMEKIRKNAMASYNTSQKRKNNL